ncbi:unnamed protein product [Didymodactylos carnosus]|uniref:Reverse transcriptase RNase H-like domain-containing protein n=1 Tax=Didymodactylos carnosus TaxID=1234261 RepID=A0A814UH71_9BILA|nr:unnamed protein product [Didymodactylos carnosus]CAF3938377.1 unnamed protein product [Didymodactylos carnosus]
MDLVLRAIVWGTQHFRPYLEGRPFEVWTDHRSLQWLRSIKDLTSRLARWAMKLDAYDMIIKHRPVVVSADQKHDQYIAISNRVKNYLQSETHLRSKRMVKVLNQQQYVQNSDKLGLGYNPINGNPTCYSGLCQLEGFKHEIFNLNYQQIASGSCTAQLIPQHVRLDCYPSTTLPSPDAEIIDTVEQLHNATMSSIDIEKSKYDNNFTYFTYGNSFETKYMIDNIRCYQTKTIKIKRKNGRDEEKTNRN